MEPARQPLSEKEAIKILLEEYRVLYDLLQWRLSATDRRVAVAAGMLVAALTAVHTANPSMANLVLWGIPIVLWVIESVAVGHCRSKEDLLRRISEIEQRTNTFAGRELLTFQSRRPGQEWLIGGRTGRAAVNATGALCIALLGFCSFLYPSYAGMPSWTTAAYGVYVGLWAVLILRAAIKLQSYEDERASLIRKPDAE